MMRSLLVSTAIIALLLSPSAIVAFQPNRLLLIGARSSLQQEETSLNVFVGGAQASSTRGDQQRYEGDSKKNPLLDDFRTSYGELVDPYKVLNVQRDADVQKIKKSYWKLSKKYHPDAVRRKDILPGSCNNLEEVREMWERVKLSYEILSDHTRRLRYDRNTFLADPKAAASRAAMDLVGWGIGGIGKGIGKGVSSVGKGMWNVGAAAVRQAAESAAASKEEEEKKKKKEE